jgi:hypothetical protein
MGKVITDKDIANITDATELDAEVVATGELDDAASAVLESNVLNEEELEEFQTVDDTDDDADEGDENDADDADDEEGDENDADDDEADDDDDADDENDDADDGLPEWAAPFTAEFKDTGDISKESIDKIVEEQGIPRQYIEDHIALKKAQVQQVANTKQGVFNTAVYDAAGGQESYSEMLKFAGENYSDKEIAAFNKAVDSKKASQATMAVELLKAKFDAAKGPSKKASKPTRLNGKAATNGSVTKPYNSEAEVLADMEDSRYRTDPAFNAKVAKRLSVSNV